jgi:hypothetical protein
MRKLESAMASCDKVVTDIQDILLVDVVIHYVIGLD